MEMIFMRFQAEIKFFFNIPEYLQSVLHGHSVNLLICLVACGIYVQ
jgi:hypothetical protein